MLLAAVVFVALAILEIRTPVLGTGDALVGNVVFFLLINLNLVLLVLMVFLVIRNFARLALERRRRILGARLRTRLVLAFVALTLFPMMFLFGVAQGFLGRAFDTWFNVRVGRALSSALEIAEVTYQQAGSDALRCGQVVAAAVSRAGLLQPEQRRALESVVAEKRAEFGVAGLRVVSPAGETLAAAGSQAAGEVRLLVEPPLVARLARGETWTGTRRRKGQELVRAAVPVTDSSGRVLAGVVVDYAIARKLSRGAHGIAQSYGAFRQLNVLRRPMKNSYILILFLITLVVIFAGTWLSFRMAKTITGPIQKLAEGTREVAQGNWDHRIEAAGDDELGTLVTAFNQMTAELKTIHGQLEERRRYIETVLANIAAGVVSINRSGEVTTVNRAAEVMLGLDGASVCGRHWRAVFVGAELDAVGKTIAPVAGGQRDAVDRQICLSRGDRPLTVRVGAAVLRDDTGAGLGAMLFFEDVSQMLRVQRMEAWREVARRIAHEIKNPLTPIQLCAQRLRKQYEPALDRRRGALFDECTRTIIRQVEELKRLVNEFSSFARLPAATMALEDLNAVAEEALVLFREGHREIGFAFAPAGDLPLVEIDREAVKRVLINLLDNAVGACQSTGDGIAPRIEVATAYEPRLAIARLEVADNGCGVPATVRGRLFEPYVSTKKEGTGLGLAIVAAIAAEHRAYVRVGDNTPRGSRFSVEFPLRRGENAPRHTGALT